MNSPAASLPAPPSRPPPDSQPGSLRLRLSCVAVAGILLAAPAPAATNYTLVAWNNLGMHCMDSDFSVFCILPPYNTIHAQLVGHEGATTRLLTNSAGYTATYQAASASGGSTNRSSLGKSNFWDYCPALFGAARPPDVGLPVPGPESYAMPGASNAPQGMRFESAFRWFAAYGIPITPYDDRQVPNTYPMMRVTARNATGAPLASTEIVLPVSDEMDCRLCHASGSGDAALPLAGWVWNPDPGIDYRLNILRLHDQLQSDHLQFRAALQGLGYNTNGLYPTVTVNHRPILCAACHLSEALPGSGRPGIPPLTQAMHDGHAAALDPRNGLSLQESANRTSCYACHPGSTTRCLRGAMGSAVALDGTMAMQCQSCHGSMSDVGSPSRTGWLDEPRCQSCHTGTALQNSGQIRYADAFESPGVWRTPTNTTFATQPDTPAPGLSLYRFSAGHGGLQCSACHGSTHAEFPSALSDDNRAAIAHQGHAGVLAECSTCHGPSQPLVRNGGPHGMHSIGAAWAQEHADILEGSGGPAECRACHGIDYRGTVLSRALGDRTVTTDKFGPRTFWRGYQIGCFECHDGPASSNPSPHGHPVVTDLAASTPAGIPADVSLPSGAGALRIVSQPANGTVGLSGGIARYFPETGFSGTDRFTYAASNGYTDSNLGTVTMTVILLDSDADGMPDWWEQSVFGNSTNAVATVDADSDGMSNLSEFTARTDARDGRSRLRMMPPKPPLPGGAMPVGFVTTAGPTYAVDRKADLRAGAWVPVATGIPGKDGVREVSDTNAPAAQLRFYRARIMP